MSVVDAHWELTPKIKKLRDELAPNTLLTITESTDIVCALLNDFECKNDEQLED